MPCRSSRPPRSGGRGGRPCDTNGGTLPTTSSGLWRAVVERVPAGSPALPRRRRLRRRQLPGGGAGRGEPDPGLRQRLRQRSATADLLAVAANLQLKMGIRVLDDARIGELTDVSRFVAEVCNLAPEAHRAYVGNFASPKGGLHVSAVVPDVPGLRAHRSPGRRKRPPPAHSTSRERDAAGTGGTLGLEIDDAQIGAALERLKQLEFRGATPSRPRRVAPVAAARGEGWRRAYSSRSPSGPFVEESSGEPRRSDVRVEVDGERVVPLPRAWPRRLALPGAAGWPRPTYPDIAAFHLTDYKVHILDPAPPPRRRCACSSRRRTHVVVDDVGCRRTSSRRPGGRCSTRWWSASCATRSSRSRKSGNEALRVRSKSLENVP